MIKSKGYDFGETGLYQLDYSTRISAYAEYDKYLATVIDRLTTGCRKLLEFSFAESEIEKIEILHDNCGKTVNMYITDLFYQINDMVISFKNVSSDNIANHPFTGSLSIYEDEVRFISEGKFRFYILHFCDIVPLHIDFEDVEITPYKLLENISLTDYIDCYYGLGTLQRGKLCEYKSNYSAIKQKVPPKMRELMCCKTDWSHIENIVYQQSPAGNTLNIYIDKMYFYSHTYEYSAYENTCLLTFAGVSDYRRVSINYYFDMGFPCDENKIMCDTILLNGDAFEYVIHTCGAYYSFKFMDVTVSAQTGKSTISIIA